MFVKQCVSVFVWEEQGHCDANLGKVADLGERRAHAVLLGKGERVVDVELLLKGVLRVLLELAGARGVLREERVHETHEVHAVLQLGAQVPQLRQPRHKALAPQTLVRPARERTLLLVHPVRLPVAHSTSFQKERCAKRTTANQLPKRENRTNVRSFTGTQTHAVPAGVIKEMVGRNDRAELCECLNEISLLLCVGCAQKKAL